jgi:hypothetical protein
MLVEFACLIKFKTDIVWNPVERHIGYVHALLVLTLMKPLFVPLMDFHSYHTSITQASSL